MSITGIHDHFARMAEYNYWANEKLSNHILELDEEVIDKEAASSFPTVKQTLLHISDAEQVWLNRLYGHSMNEWPSASFSGTKEVLVHEFLTPSISWKKYVAQLEPNRFLQPFTYQNTKGKEFTNQVADAITQVFNHSTYHRGQIISILNQLEVANIPQTDFIKFIRDMG